MKKMLLLAGVCLFALNVVAAEECTCGKEEAAVVAQAPAQVEAKAEVKADVTVAANEVTQEVVVKEDTKKVTQDLEKPFAELEKDSKEETKAA